MPDAPLVTPPSDYAFGKPLVVRAHHSKVARIAIPGYGGYRPATCPGKVSAASSPRTTSTSSVYTGLSSRDGSPGKPQSRRAWRAAPGYTGYVPGKVANGTMAQTFHSANKSSSRELARELRRARSAPPPEVQLAPEKIHARHIVPGYSGFMPGRKADNLIGTSAAKAARDGWLMRERATALGGGIYRCD